MAYSDYLTLIQNAILWDTETLGLARGMPMHELALYDLQERKLYEYIIEPRLVVADGNTAGDMLVSSSMERHRWSTAKTIPDLIKATVALATGKEREGEALMKALEWQNPFLSRALKTGKYPHLLGGVETVAAMREREKKFQDFGGIRAELGKQTVIEDVLRPGSAVLQKLRGKTIFMANSSFESKMLGAQIGAMLDAGMDVGFKEIFETRPIHSPDPMYVTGVEVNKARAMAMKSGDWTQVWRAYLANPPKAGQTAVRDIQDVLRAIMSYGKKLGLFDTKNIYLGTAMDVSFRMFGSLEPDPVFAKKLLEFAGAHRAAEDAAIVESYVLGKALPSAAVLQAVEERTTEGLAFVEAAKRGQGPLVDVANYFARLEKLQTVMTEQSITQRLARAQKDLLLDGITWQQMGWEKYKNIPSLTFEGKPTEVAISGYKHGMFTDMQSVVKFLSQQEQYSPEEVASQWSSLQQAMGRYEDKLEAVSRWEDEGVYTLGLEQRVVKKAEAKIAAEWDIIRSTTNNRLGKFVSGYTRSAAGESAQQLLQGAVSNWNWKSVGRGAVAAAGLLTLTGALWSMSKGSQQDAKPRSIVSFDYYDWLERQAEFSGSYQQDRSEPPPGLLPTGVAGLTRRENTDFASPYRGPITSNMVLANQELLEEREKYLREQYGVQHFDPIEGIFGIYGPFAKLNMWGRQGYSFIDAGKPLDSKNKTGLRGNYLMSINLSDGRWKADVEDADTIVVKRGGIRGAIASFFGFNKGYSFRLAGVDATEVAHGDQGPQWHVSQPYADAATEAFRSLIKGSKNLQLVYDPGNTTYGRMMGAVFADGQNLNFEVVRRGIAAFLPYGKPEESMIDYSSMEVLERGAHQNYRGLWSQPWARAFFDTSAASNNRVTFNTLARKERIAENTSMMSMVSLMETAQARGMYNTAHQVAAAQIGKFYEEGADNVKPEVFENKIAPHNSYLHEMQVNMGEFIRTHGTGRYGYRYARDSGYGNLDARMAIDSMRTTNSIWNRSRLRAFDNYGTRSASDRRARMAEAQRNINQQFGRSPIGHTDMS